MNYDELQTVSQLVQAIGDAIGKMEESFSKRDIENFNKAKKAVLDLQRQAAKILSKEER